MSEKNVPAGNTGGYTTASVHAELVDLPPKLRIHALAKLVGVSSRQVMTVLADLGVDARSAQSSVGREAAVRVAEILLADTDASDAAAPDPADSAAETALAATARAKPPVAVFAPPSPVFLPPQTVVEVEPASVARSASPSAAPKGVALGNRARNKAAVEAPADDVEEELDEESGEPGSDDTEAGRRRRRRGRRGRGRGRGGQGEDGVEEQHDDDDEDDESAESDESAEQTEDDAQNSDGGDPGSRRRRRRRRRKVGIDDDAASSEDDPPNTVVHVRDVVRETRDARDDAADSAAAQDEVRSIRGSTRLEAKRQRRRDGREAGRRRVPILSEAEFLARREAVDRKMVVRERPDRTQIAVSEDGVLVEHFVTSVGTGSLVGNVYLGRVQNVLPSMEAAFIDIGRGRNAVLYAGEVDWDAAGLGGKARKIEQALSTGDSVLVQVTKDPVGHKGARLTTQISLPGRFLVYVPGGGATGISRKLPDNERKRLKDILKRVVPEDAGVIIRTASEGIAEAELGRDVRRLQTQWDIIREKADQPGAKAPQLLYEEPDLLVKVVRDLFTEDFSSLVVQGGDAWETIDAYVRHVAPDLTDRLSRHVGTTDVFTEHRIEEQLTKALDRKVWLPSGGYLVIERTEAMTVIDVNTGKYTGSGGNLEETVTRNNLESAEEIVRQLRLRDIGGIIVIDFIDMVLESNRDLVLRRLTECLGRDRTRHQVAEVTSLGLVQMTRKRVGTGLLEAFSSTCEHCRGRGVVMSTEPLQAHNQGGSGGGDYGAGSQPAGRKGRQKGRSEHADNAQPAVEAPTEAEHVPDPVEEASQQESSRERRATAQRDRREARREQREARREARNAAAREAGESEAGSTDVFEVIPAEVADAEVMAESRGGSVIPAAEPTAAENLNGGAATTHVVSAQAGSTQDATARAVEAVRAVETAPEVVGAGTVNQPESTLNGHGADGSEAPVPARASRRRQPRRAASRPAGPPLGVTES